MDTKQDICRLSHLVILTGNRKRVASAVFRVLRALHQASLGAPATPQLGLIRVVGARDDLEHVQLGSIPWAAEAMFCMFIGSCEE